MPRSTRAMRRLCVARCSQTHAPPTPVRRASASGLAWTRVSKAPVSPRPVARLRAPKSSRSPVPWRSRRTAPPSRLQPQLPLYSRSSSSSPRRISGCQCPRWRQQPAGCRRPLGTRAQPTGCRRSLGTQSAACRRSLGTPPACWGTLGQAVGLLQSFLLWSTSSPSRPWWRPPWPTWRGRTSRRKRRPPPWPTRCGLWGRG
mmetsp:Transcript_34924/g.84359  ORF Transcript_34924/g.84359 Transcript_34924/m.84359 type:complete len:201 (-) Transcript_34924:108-710(-)